MNVPFIPTNTQELLMRAHQFAGWSFHEIIEYLQIPPPKSLKQEKGWAGQCVERLLGAPGGNQPQPDFVDLCIELKTIPIHPNATPLESTYVCTAPIPFRETVWTESRVYHKISQILWVPILVEPSQPLLARRLGQAYLWSPDHQEMRILQQDWEELTEYLILGQVERLSARLGTFLHIRPKAANSQHPIRTLNEEGELIYTVPKGFYLRPTLTKTIFTRYYATA